MTRAQVARLKKAFLKQFAEYGNITTAATQAGIARRTVYGWQEQDDQFAAAFRDAEIQATEVLEQEARRRAVEGVITETPIYAHGIHVDTAVETKYSDTLMIFLLKARNPAKYRDNSRVELTGKDGGPVDIDVRPTDRLSGRIAGLAARIGVASLDHEPPE